MSSASKVSTLDLNRLTGSFLAYLQKHPNMADLSEHESLFNPDVTDPAAPVPTCAATPPSASVVPQPSLKRVIPKTELVASASKKQKSKSRASSPVKKSAGGITVSKVKTKPPVPSRRLPLRQSVRRATLLKTETQRSTSQPSNPNLEDIDASDSDVEEIPPPAYLSRYASNRRLCLIRDRKYPELREFSGEPFSDRFISIKAA